MNNALFLNTILLGGSTSEKVAAARAAGFDEIELWRQDLETVPGGPGAVRGLLSDEKVGLTDYQVILDFDGAPGNRRVDKRTEATTMLDQAAQVGSPTLLVPASTDPNCDPDRVEEDMQWLSHQAADRGVRVAYEGMAWSTVNHTLPSAWGLVQHLDEPNLGLVVDTFHLFTRRGTADDLNQLEPERIYLVQLSDLGQPSDIDPDVDLDHVIETARHHRLLPGKGRFPLDTVVRRLQMMGYAGPVGLEVFNDDLQAQDPALVAQQAMASLRRCWRGLMPHSHPATGARLRFSGR
jgi:4-hydroxyphenylpyruvate dioxygenase